MRGFLGIATAAIVSNLVCSTPSYSDQNYVIPDDLIPMSEWALGTSAKEAEQFRINYRARDFWTGTDNTVFAYLNLSEVLNTMVVSRAGPVAHLDVEANEAVAGVVATTKLGRMSLGKAIKDPRSRLQAIAVIHQGKIVFEEYPGMKPLQRHSWNSAAKPILGLIIYQLIDEGLVDLNKSVADYLPFTSSHPVGTALLRDVLHHRTGLDYEETNASISDPQHPIGFGFAQALAGRNETSSLSVKDALSKVGVERKPGEAFQYSSYNTQILGLIAETVTGQPLNEIIGERIWQKVGMKGDALLGLSSAGEALGAGAFSSTLRDFARFGMLFTPSWKHVSNQRIVPEEFLADVYAAADPQSYLKGNQGNRMVAGFGKQGAPHAAAYQWDAVFSDGDLFKPGINGQAIYVSPETDTVVVYFSTTFRNSLYLISYARGHRQ